VFSEHAEGFLVTSLEKFVQKAESPVLPETAAKVAESGITGVNGYSVP
jgi:hypothetical protein